VRARSPKGVLSPDTAEQYGSAMRPFQGQQTKPSGGLRVVALFVAAIMLCALAIVWGGIRAM
jgi:hypothetical protein